MSATIHKLTINGIKNSKGGQPLASKLQSWPTTLMEGERGGIDS